MDNLQENILEAISLMIDERLKELAFNKKVEGVITEVVGDDYYKVMVNDSEMTVKALNGKYEVGNQVLITIFNNNKHMVDERRIIGLK